MLTRLAVRNFKLFEEIELDLGQQVVLIGPNNAGKTTALQALALWDVGLKRWLEKRGAGAIPSKRPGVTVNRRDLIALPVPTAKLLWRDLHTHTGGRYEDGRQRTEHVRIEIVVDGIDWSCGFEFDYANEESFYCRPLRQENGERMPVPEAARDVRVAYLPPMSGLAASETRLDQGAINVRLGEGRTAEVLRNLCYRILEEEDGAARWQRLDERIHKLFGSRLDEPKYIAERGEISMTYRPRDDLRLDLSACGRGQQQTMLLLAHMAANPGSVLLLDEPDAHLEILRQRQIYQVLSETADETRSQIIAASHSEVMLNEAAGRDVLIALVGKPHRHDNRGSQVAKALKDIGFEHYVQAEKTGWMLYLEGATDLAILLALALRLDHPAVELLEAPYVHYVANQPQQGARALPWLARSEAGPQRRRDLRSPRTATPGRSESAPAHVAAARAGELSLQARGPAGLRAQRRHASWGTIVRPHMAVTHAGVHRRDRACARNAGRTIAMGSRHQGQRRLPRPALHAFLRASELAGLDS